MPEGGEIRVPASAGGGVAALVAAAHRYRVYLLLAAVATVMACLSESFRAGGNVGNILKAASVNLLAGAGFTVVMIAGQLDLSIGSAITMGGMMAVGLAPQLGWTGSFAVAIACGVALGAVNGALVAKAKINSFIVTLGTMIVVQNVMMIYCRGGTIAAGGFELSDWFQRPLLAAGAGRGALGWLMQAARASSTPQIILPLVLTAAVAFFLRWTAVGKGFYLLGGNPQTAWYSGLAVDRYTIGAFVMSGSLSALGGAILAASEANANPTQGDGSLMTIVAAVIIGGTSMKGGKGGVVGSTVALAALAALINGLNCCGQGYEVQLMAGGVVLAAVILIDAWRVQQKDRLRGQRHELLAELAHREQDPLNEEGNQPMNEKKDRTFALACVAMVSCVAIVAIFAFYLLQIRQNASPAPQGFAPLAPGVGSVTSQPAASEVDVSSLKGTDNQPLIVMDNTPLNPPPRPADPTKLPDDDPLRWYDMEYAGWRCEKVNMPVSPGNGPRGKHVVCLRHMDHPYTTACTRGMQRVADAYGIELKTLTAGNADVNIQSQQVDQVINERPDLVILFPVDARSVVPMFRKLNQAGIPVIASNLIPVDEGMKYVLTWTGPDDWGQFRMLAREFARLMNYEGGYCIVQHMPGGSAFFSRTYGVVSELKQIAPKMKLLEMQTTKLEAQKTAQVVSSWITKYGTELKGIVSADDSGVQIGINEAIDKAGRNDIIRVSAGNSKVGMDFIKAGKLQAITYQSAEADGALPMKLAADWFSGKKIEKGVYYLRKHIITAADVDQFLPAQW